MMETFNKIVLVGMSVLVGIMALTSQASAKTDYRQFCVTTSNGVTYRQECRALRPVAGYYETVRGDYFVIFCEKPGYPVAYKCELLR